MGSFSFGDLMGNDNELLEIVWPRVSSSDSMGEGWRQLGAVNRVSLLRTSSLVLILVDFVFFLLSMWGVAELVGDGLGEGSGLCFLAIIIVTKGRDVAEVNER